MFLRRCLISFLALLLLSQNGVAQTHEITVQLKWWHQFQFAGYYAAVKKGYYAKEKLNVKLIPADASHNVVDDVLSGNADFGITGCDLLIEFANGKPVVALGAIFQHSPYVIMSLPKAHINSPSDLVGKTIMGSVNQGWVELKALFLKEGIDLKNLKLVDHTWNNADFVQGKVDAMTGYRSVEPFQLQQSGVRPFFILPVNYGIDFYGDILFSTKAYVQNNSNLVEKFREASFQGWEYALSHKSEICDYILTLPGVSERKVTKAALLYEANEMEKLILPQLIEIGHMNEGRWKHIVDIHQELGLIPKNISLDEFLYQRKPSLSESLKNIGFVVLGSAALLFLMIIAYGIMIRKAVKRKTKEQRIALEALGVSEEKYRMLIEQASDGIIICDPDFCFTHANAAFLNMLKYTEEELYQMHFSDIILIQEGEPSLRFDELKTKQSFNSQRIARRKDGSTLIIEIRSNILPNGNYMGFIRDITKMKEADEQLRKQERQLDLIYNKVADCIFVLGVSQVNEFYFISVNQAFLTVTGLQESDVVNKNITEVLPASTLPMVLQKYKEAINQKKTIQWEEETVYPAGTKVGIVSVTPVFDNDKCVQLIGSVHDITEKKDLEKTLDKVYRLSRIGVWELDMQSDRLTWSPVTGEIHEAPAELVSTMEQGICFYKEGESRDKIRNLLSNAVKDGIPFSDEFQIVTMAGNIKWVRTTGEAEFKDGKCVRLYGSSQDIDDRKKAEIAFLSTLTERNTILESIGDAFFALDKNAIVTYWNAVAERLLSTPKEAILNRCLWDVFSDSNDSESYKKYNKAITSGKAEHFEDFYPTLKKWFEISAYPSVTGLSVYFKDITERKAAELNLLQFKNVIENSKDGIGILSVPGQDIYMNNSFMEMLGYSEEELAALGGPMQLYEDQEQGKIMFDNIFNGKYWRGDVRLRNRQNQVLDLYLSSGPVINDKNEVVAVYGIHTDIGGRKKMERELIEFNNRIVTILESITDGFFSVDRNWVVTYWNKEAEKLLGVSPSKVIGNNIWDFYGNNLPSTFKDAYFKIIDENRSVHFEEYYELLQKWFEVSAYPSSQGLSVYFKDITERKSIQEEIRISNERYNYVAKATNDSIWDWNLLTNEVVRAGNNFQQIFGYDSAEADKNNYFWETLVHPDDLDRVVQRRNLVFAEHKNDYWEDEYRFRKADGEYAFVYDKGYIIRDADGKAIRMIGSISDISERKKQEESLKKLNANLEKINKDLALSNQELEQFAYVASHDLQEPLRMVTSFLTQLDKKYHTQLDDKAHQYIHFAVDGAKRMRQIILELLEYSRVGRMDNAKEEIDLNLLINEIKLLQRKSIEEKSAVIKTDNLPVIHSFRAPLLQVFQNLVSNAIKYSKEDIPPLISIRASESESFWTFAIEDNGIGINEDYFDKIFVIFQRLHTRSEYSGTGMGLAIVKKIVENMGGYIQVTSEPGKGSIFTFTIPK